MELISNLIHVEDDDIWAAPSTYAEEAIFNFDALILSTSAVIDYEERAYYFTKIENRSSGEVRNVVKYSRVMRNEPQIHCNING